MEKFILNITASSGEFFQGECESLTLPTADGQYGVQAGHSPVLVALEMGIMQFTVNGETRSDPHLRCAAGRQRRAPGGYR